MSISIRPATVADHPLLVAHYRALWRSYGVAEADIRDDADDAVRAFIDEARQSREMAAFIAETQGTASGSLMWEVELFHIPMSPELHSENTVTSGQFMLSQTFVGAAWRRLLLMKVWSTCRRSAARKQCSMHQTRESQFT
jgi:hypothetical protein